MAGGVVFSDRNGNGRRDALERGLPGVAVSNGRDVVRTDWRGRYRLPVDDDAILFVVKPRGWAPPTDEQGLPRFYRIHKPAGSPEGLRFAGVAPTGPLPASVDFPLRRRPEPDAFRVVVLGDPQPYDRTELDYLARDVVAELVGIDAAFGLSLGDLVGDDLSLFEPLNGVVGAIGIPWYNVHGNHDMNFDAATDEHADETWERVYGPASYAFQVGRVHFVVLDDVVYQGAAADGGPGRYAGGLGADQLAFVGGYLEGVPEQELVVVALHIPLVGPPPHRVAERRQLFEILARHPHTFSISGHTHLQAHHFLGPEEGWPGPRPHHHLNAATASGSWWRGEPDPAGIPHATMRCGAPNGYSILSFDGNRYAVRFKAARRPAAHQMRVEAPARIPAARAAGAEIFVNVFAGSERSRVEMRLGEAAGWIRLERVEAVDPGYAALHRQEAAARPPDGYGLPAPVLSPHLWVGRLPADTGPGQFVLEVRSLDAFGQEHRLRRPLRVE